MMDKNRKKKALLILMGKPDGEEGGDYEKEKEKGLLDDEEESADVGDLLSEMFTALKAGDLEGAASAFKEAVNCCNDEGMEE